MSRQGDGCAPAAAAMPGRRAGAMLAVTMLLWGLNLPAVKWLTGEFDPVLMSAIRTAAACILLAWMLPRRSPLPRFSAADWRLLVLCGGLMVYLNQWLLSGGVARSSATNGALIVALNPLAASVLALWLYGERAEPRRVAGVLMGLLGVGLVILQRPGAELTRAGLGDLMVVGAVFVFTLGAMLLQRLLSVVDAALVGLTIHGVGALCLGLHAGVAWIWGGASPKASGNAWVWLLLVLVGAMITGGGNLLWNRASRLIGVARASVWMYWVPIFGVAAAVAFLGEPLTAWHVAGLVLVLGGTWLGTTVRR